MQDTTIAQKLGSDTLSEAAKHAFAFVKTIAGKATAEAYFRTFDDNAKRNARQFARKFHGSLKSIAGELSALNEKCVGAFMVINAGGQSKDEITHVRAVFADTDGAPLEPLLRLEPHMVVQSSPGKWHVYWLVGDDFPLDQFKAVQLAIAKKFGTDPAVNDLSRVMRVPGFYHCKGEPFLVKIVKRAKGLLPYSLQQIVDGLGLDTGTTSVELKTDIPLDNSLITPSEYPPADANRVADNCKQVARFRETGGESEPLWYACLGVLKHCTDGEKYAHQWSSNHPGYDEAETQAKMDQWEFGPSTCDKFRSVNPQGCDGCAHTCKSPIQLGSDSAVATKNNDVFEWFNGKYAVARYLGSVVILETDCPGIVGYMKERDFSLLYRNKTITVPHGNGTKQIGAVTAWLASENRRTHPEGAHFAPGQTLPTGQFNTWRGWPVVPSKGDWSNFREFLHEVICAGDEAVFNYVRKLLARWVQLPHLPGHVAIFMRGDKGVGKSFFARKIGSFFEPHAIYVGDRNLLTGTFTGHFREVNFAFFDEAVWNGSHEDANRLKALITEKDMMLHPKGLTPYRVSNSMHIIVATNDEFAASASHDERRVCMLSPSNARRIDRQYFSDIDKAWNDGEQAAMLFDLLNTDIAGFNPENIPQTDELTNQKVLSLPESERVIFELLRDGIHWPDGGGHGKVAKQMLAEQLSERSSGIEKRQADTRMGNAVKRIFGVAVQEKREASGGRQRVWILPPLSDARKLFQQHLNVSGLDWE